MGRKVHAVRLFRCFGIALTMLASMSAINAPAHAVANGHRHMSARAAGRDVAHRRQRRLVSAGQSQHCDIHARRRRFGADAAVNDTARGDP